MKVIGILSLIFLLFFAPGCSVENAKNENIEAKEHNKKEGHTENGQHSEEILLSDETLKEFGIEVKEARAGVIKTHIYLTGEINITPSRISHIIPRFNGVVKRVYKTVGDKVIKGDTLALIESNESLTQYDVLSFIDGTIIEMHMTQGELIGTETHAFTIANLSEVWATFNIYQKDIWKIKAGQKVLVTVGSMKIEETGTISYVSPIVDENTRTATARVVLNNQSGKWMPGMFVTAKAYVSEKMYPIVIEKSALQTLDDQIVVFVKDEDGGFLPQIVKTGNENDDKIEIISGLKSGEKYVAKNSFTLKAEILKESFGGNHGH